MRLGLPLVLLAASCASVPEGKRVEEAELSGAKGLDPEEVLEGLQHHPPDGWIFVDYAAYEPLAIELDRRRIESYYRRRGWFSAKVTNVEIGNVEDGVTVRFVVDEGEPSLLRGVAVTGAPPEEESAMRAVAEELPVGAPFDYGLYEEGKAKLRRMLVARGFVHAEVGGRAEVDRDRREVHASYSIDPGPRAIVGKISVEGLELLPERFVLDRCAFAAGDRFDPDRLDVTRARILETGLAESVRFGWDREKRDGTLDLVVGVSEGPRNELRFGGGVGHGNGLEIRALGSYARKSFFDPLLTLRLTLRPSWSFLFNNADQGGPSIEAGVELERQDVLWWPRTVGTLGAEYRLVQLEAYTTNGPSLALGLGRPFFDDRLRAGLRLQYDYFDIGLNFDPELTQDVLQTAGILDPLHVLFVGPQLIYDGRDDAIDPRLGYWGELRGEVGQTFGLGAYATLTTDVRGYVPLYWRRLVLAHRVRFGFTPFAESTVPITRRFFAGGPESQRGFVRRRLAPTIAGQALPVGGEALFETSLELRLDLFQLFGQWLGIVAFADGADAVAKLEDLDLGNLHWAAGGGLRYRTPVGAIRVDVGVRLNRTGAGEPDGTSQRWAIHISLGEAF